jgi:hypothetical protein
MQNEKTLQQMIKEHEAQMPPEIMNLIKSFDWKKEIRTIVSQNQLMIDVGADLEESTYLMILGVIRATDLYERLIDTHQIPEDKTAKIIQELENQIFNPLHKKLIELDKKPVSSNSRDVLLEEIEREPEVLINLNVASIQENKTQDKIISPVATSDGIVKPFTLSTEKTVQIEKEQIVTPMSAPIIKITPAQGVQENPVEAALTKPTVTQAPIIQKPIVMDPYREPIE